MIATGTVGSAPSDGRIEEDGGEVQIVRLLKPDFDPV
jgi:hypothetical protein